MLLAKSCTMVGRVVDASIELRAGEIVGTRGHGRRWAGRELAFGHFRRDADRVRDDRTVGDSGTLA